MFNTNAALIFTASSLVILTFRGLMIDLYTVISWFLAKENRLYGDVMILARRLRVLAVYRYIETIRLSVSISSLCIFLSSAITSQAR